MPLVPATFVIYDTAANTATNRNVVSHYQGLYDENYDGTNAGQFTPEITDPDGVLTQESEEIFADDRPEDGLHYTSPGQAWAPVFDFPQAGDPDDDLAGTEIHYYLDTTQTPNVASALEEAAPLAEQQRRVMRRAFDQALEDRWALDDDAEITPEEQFSFAERRRKLLSIDEDPLFATNPLGIALPARPAFLRRGRSLLGLKMPSYVEDLIDDDWTIEAGPSSALSYPTNSGGKTGTRTLRVTGASMRLRSGKRMRFDASRLYKCEVRVKVTALGATTGTLYAGFKCYDKNNAGITNAWIAANALQQNTIGTGYVVFTGYFKGVVAATSAALNGRSVASPSQLPEGTVTLAPMAYINYNGSGADLTSGMSTVDIDWIEIEPVLKDIAGELINDGAITEGKLGSSAVTAGKIANLAVTSGKLADGAVVAAKIADGSIDFVKILAGAAGRISESYRGFSQAFGISANTGTPTSAHEANKITLTPGDVGRSLMVFGLLDYAPNTGTDQVRLNMWITAAWSGQAEVALDEAIDMGGTGGGGRQVTLMFGWNPSTSGQLTPAQITFRLRIAKNGAFNNPTCTGSRLFAYQSVR